MKTTERILSEARFQGHSPERRLMEIVATCEQADRLRGAKLQKAITAICELYGCAPSAGKDAILEALLDL